MRLLISGVSGFVGRHFLRFMEESGVDAEVLGVSRDGMPFNVPSLASLRCTYRQLDMLDRAALGELMAAFRPTHVLHLAAYSSVGFSWKSPAESFANNTNILLNLLEQIRTLGLKCRVLSVGSSEEYGNVDEGQLPLREDTPLRPISPYAVARVAQEMLSRVYVDGYGLDIVMTRSFNHIGAHQREDFAISSFAKQLTRIRRGTAPPRVVTGDRSIVRDFVDVRDVVRAYFELLTRGTAGAIYNVCSGNGVSIQSMLDIMQAFLGTAATLETDPKLIRPTDNRVVVGSNDKIRFELGWQPRFDIHDSLASVLDWWTTQLESPQL